MSRNVELPDDVYARVEQRAAAAGMTVVEWIAAGAPALCAEPCTPASENGGEPHGVTGNGQPPRTLADEFAGRVGLISSGRGDLSQRTGKLFAEGMLEKRRRGHL